MPTGTLATLRVRLIHLAGAIAPAGSLRRATAKRIGGALAPIGGLILGHAIRYSRAVLQAGRRAIAGATARRRTATDVDASHDAEGSTEAR
jgi:hypothetical protein